MFSVCFFDVVICFSNLFSKNLYFPIFVFFFYFSLFFFEKNILLFILLSFVFLSFFFLFFWGAPGSVTLAFRSVATPTNQPTFSSL